MVGDSHLRALVDGFSVMPDGDVSWGYLSVPGASASVLCQEVIYAVVRRSPDAVCVMGCSNNLTSSPTVGEAAADFRDLLQAALGRWPNVCFSLILLHLQSDCYVIIQFVC